MPLKNLTVFHLTPNKKAFSVAEAMIVLLIVSIALAAMAPILSKKTANNSGSFSDKWIYTANGKDISRPVNNVGIGLERNSNPNAKLHIKSSLDEQTFRIDVTASQKNSIIQIYKDNKLVTSMDKDGKWSPDSTPANAVMFFRSPNCPTGWAKADGIENSLNLQGRFLRGAGGYSTCSWDGANERYTNCSGNPNNAQYNGAYEDTGREIWGSFDLYGQTGVWQENGGFWGNPGSYDGGSITADGAKNVRSQVFFSSKYVSPRGPEFMPRNIALTPCIKL